MRLLDTINEWIIIINELYARNKHIQYFKIS